MNDDIDLEELAPWLVVLITLVGGGLRVLLLASKGMWLDETFSVWVAHHNVGEMLHWIVKIDQHPPLYYLLLRGWMALRGNTPYDVRLLSALFGAGAIPLIYLIGKRMSGAMLGLAAAVLLAVSPFNIYYAQETRMYTLLTFNVAAAMYALVRLLTDARAGRPIGSQIRDYWLAWRASEPVESNAQSGWRAWISRHRRPPIQTVETDLAWVALIVFSAATLLTHNTAVLFLFAINLFVLGLLLFQRRKPSGPLPAFQAPSLANWVKAQIGILILWSPWSVAFLRQAGRVYQAFWIPKPDVDAVIRVLESFLNPSLSYLQGSQVSVMWILYGLVLGLGLLYYRKKLSHFLFLAALFVVPFAGELLVSLRRPIFLDRTLIWTTIPLLLVMAAGIAQLKFRFLMIVAVGILSTSSLFSASDYYRFWQKEDWSTPAGYVANFAEEGDLVLFNSNFVVIPFDYYFAPYEKQYAIQVEKQGVPADLFIDGVLEPKMTESDVSGLKALVSGRRRVWLVYSHDSYTDPKGLIPQTLASQMTLIRQRDFYGGRVQLYEAP